MSLSHRDSSLHVSIPQGQRDIPVGGWRAPRRRVKGSLLPSRRGWWGQEKKPCFPLTLLTLVNSCSLCHWGVLVLHELGLWAVDPGRAQSSSVRHTLSLCPPPGARMAQCRPSAQMTLSPGFPLSLSLCLSHSLYTHTCTGGHTHAPRLCHAPSPSAPVRGTRSVSGANRSMCDASVSALMHEVDVNHCTCSTFFLSLALTCHPCAPASYRLFLISL